MAKSNQEQRPMAANNVFLPAFALALAVGLGACNKVKDTTALITVHDANGAAVVGASVKLYANPVDPLMPDFSRLTKEGVTDASGRVLFDYSDFYKRGQAGFAVLDIHAEKDSLAGDGIIRIEEEVANEELVVVEPI
ncbi:MAG: hypothetical protein IPN44_11975 [Flavobacteriales bacterium]|nr:hypothetical protein [Flavobacteriales bacterium]